MPSYDMQHIEEKGGHKIRRRVVQEFKGVCVWCEWYDDEWSDTEQIARARLRDHLEVRHGVHSS